MAVSNPRVALGLVCGALAGAPAGPTCVLAGAVIGLFIGIERQATARGV